MPKTLSKIASKIRRKSRNSVKFREQLDALEKQNELMDRKVKSVDILTQKYKFILTNLSHIYFLKKADVHLVKIVHHPILKELLNDVLEVRKILCNGIQELRAKIQRKREKIFGNVNQLMEEMKHSKPMSVGQEQEAKKTELRKLDMDIKKLKEQLKVGQDSLNELSQKYRQWQLDTDIQSSNRKRIQNENRKIVEGQHQKHPAKANDFVPASSLVRKTRYDKATF